MKILVISDSHGDSASISKVVALHKDAELLLFLGDGLRDVSQISSSLPSTLAALCVSGNCDFFSVGAEHARDEETVTFEGKRIFLTHGHKYGVKGGLGALISAAKAKDADIVLFGHTHEPYESSVESDGRRIYFFNPGSLGRSHDRLTRYGILDVRENGVLFSAAYLRE